MRGLLIALALLSLLALCEQTLRAIQNRRS